MEEENQLAGQKKLSPQFKRIVHEVKKENFVNFKNIEISSRCSYQF